MMLIIETISIILINGAIVLGPFAGLLLLNKKTRHPYLISIILCLSLIVSHSYFIGGAIGHFIESPFIIAEPFIFLISPLLYFYFLHISDDHLKHSWSDLKHIIPFVFFFVSYIPIAVHGKNSEYYNFLFSNQIVMTGFLWIILIAQYLYYYTKIYKLNKIYKLKLAEQHSNYLQYDASWVRLFLLIFLATLAFVSIILFVFLHNSTFKHFSSVVALFFSFQLYFVAYKGLNQKIISLGSTITEKTSVQDEVNYKDVSQEQFKIKKENLQEYLQNEKPYLSPDLTLIELAQQVAMSRNELSALINNVIGSNFYLYVNEFRIEHVKQLMQQDSHMQFTILALAYDSGFNSKSTFNSLFKKLTGLTPSEYRRTLS